MGAVEAVKTCLGKYVDFTGRARRAEFWFFELFVVLVIVVPAFLVFLMGVDHGPAMILLLLLWSVMCLALFLPGLAVSVRRLHDTNSSGWWYFIAFVPYVGGLILLVWYCLPGTKGPNRFGPDPLDPSGALSGIFD